LLSYKNTDGADSFFPSWVLPDNSQSSESRIGWCYGDFGIGMTLLQLADKTNDEGLKEFNKSLFHNCLRRTEAPTSDINDAGFCHGSFGIVYLYFLIQKANTLNVDLTPFIDTWIDSGVQFAKYNDGPAGFKQFHPIFGNSSYIDQLNLLEGVSGIGLVLMDILNDKKGNWSECLLL
jgi:lantibiotic modifying enzyme